MGKNKKARKNKNADKIKKSNITNHLPETVIGDKIESKEGKNENNNNKFEKKNISFIVLYFYIIL
jgi:hypothetical protein